MTTSTIGRRTFPVAENQTTIKNATEEFFGRAQGKLIGFTIEEIRTGFFGKGRKHQVEILIQVTAVKPEGGKDCWTFKGQILSQKGPIPSGTIVEGFYKGAHGNINPDWRNNVSTEFGQLRTGRTGWIRPAA